MTRTGWFIYNGFDTRSLGLTVVPGDIDGAPARNFLAHAYGGANGDFVVDTGRFDNVPRTYTIMIRGNFRATYDALCNALLPMKGYQRLTDMWAPDEYFMAYLSGPLEPTVSPDEDMGTVLVSFTRQPQRWLSGETTIDIPEYTQGNPVLITNPTAFVSSPLIVFVCSTTVNSHYYSTILSIDGITQTIVNPAGSGHNLSELFTAGETYTYDCATGRLSEDSTGDDKTRYLRYDHTGLRPHIVLTLKPGVNRVYSNEGYKSTITPRWYTI